jgi:mono/diheme cytochrome c family protein
MHRIRFVILLAVLACSILGCKRASDGRPQERDAAAIAHGEPLFADHCAICHGARGDGHGMRSQFLDPRPPDFTSQQWQVAHPEESVSNSIRNGVHGTAMPSWRTLGERQIRDLTAFVKSLP